jgi:hypothetical protein
VRAAHPVHTARRTAAPVLVNRTDPSWAQYKIGGTWKSFSRGSSSPVAFTTIRYAESLYPRPNLRRSLDQRRTIFDTRRNSSRRTRGAPSARSFCNARNSRKSAPEPERSKAGSEAEARSQRSASWQFARFRRTDGRTPPGRAHKSCSNVVLDRVFRLVDDGARMRGHAERIFDEATLPSVFDFY